MNAVFNSLKTLLQSGDQTKGVVFLKGFLGLYSRLNKG